MRMFLVVDSLIDGHGLSVSAIFLIFEWTGGRQKLNAIHNNDDRSCELW